MANILIISSGRLKGNTAQLAEAFASGARDTGHLAESVSLLRPKSSPARAATPVSKASLVCRRTVLPG